MDKTLIVEKTLIVKADKARVWEALTTKEIIKQYFFGTEAVSDWKPGSKLYFRGEFDGQSYEDKGHILEAEKEKKLVYDYWTGWSGLDDKPENYSLVSYELFPEEGATRVELRQKGFAHKEAWEHAQGGWQAVLDKLKQLLES